MDFFLCATFSVSLVSSRLQALVPPALSAVASSATRVLFLPATSPGSMLSAALLTSSSSSLSSLSSSVAVLSSASFAASQVYISWFFLALVVDERLRAIRLL